jgi:hypothetical protein
VPSPTRDSSWLAQWGWTLLQPYLQFMYLVNAYRFYSPEPGPAPIMWYYIEYEDGTVRELRIPNFTEHGGDPLGQEYTRRLSIASSVDQYVPLPGVADELKRLRIANGNPAFNAQLNGEAIPLHPPPFWVDMQYRLPTEAAKRLLAEYARHIAHEYPTSTKGSGVVGVKIYRVVHRMLDPWEMARPDSDPKAEWTYMPFYQGEFTKDGVLKDPNDPFLYWLIPIFTEDQEVINIQNPNGPPGGMARVTRDCLKIHVRLKTKVQP